MRAVLALLVLATALAGCGDPTPGATDAPPPAGGPPKNDRHPPGLTQEEQAQQR